MGDVIAAAPVIKYMIDNKHKNTDTYSVVAKMAFKPILHFVPDDKFIDFDKPWNLKGEAVSTLNTKKEGNLTRNTPKRMHLSHFASIKLTDSIIPLEHLNYVPLIKVDVSHFGIDFSKSVILVTSYRDLSRSWHSDYILGTADYIRSKGLYPIFVGKTDKDIADTLKTESSLPKDIYQYGIDLRNQTTIPELASIMEEAKAVCGLDSGPIHLAGTTSTPIVCGYTSVDAKHRIPTRKTGKTYIVKPDLDCLYCESEWIAHFWNFSKCYLKHIDCCRLMTPELFIKYLEEIL